MILVDTSAWIAFFKGGNSTADLVEEFILDNKLALCGPVQSELLRGFKNKKERDTVWPLLDGCHFLEQPDKLWIDAGNCGFALRRKGKTVKTMDLLIACYAIAYQVPMLTLDKDFKTIKAAGFPFEII